jgi:hypothetical protein
MQAMNVDSTPRADRLERVAAATPTVGPDLDVAFGYFTPAVPRDARSRLPAGWLALGIAAAPATSIVLFGTVAARSLGQTAGMGLMGLGGLVAIIGGMLFVAVVMLAVIRRPRPAPACR